MRIWDFLPRQLPSPSAHNILQIHPDVTSRLDSQVKKSIFKIKYYKIHPLAFFNKTHANLDRYYNRVRHSKHALTLPRNLPLSYRRFELGSTTISGISIALGLLSVGGRALISRPTLGLVWPQKLSDWVTQCSKRLKRLLVSFTYGKTLRHRDRSRVSLR